MSGMSNDPGRLILKLPLSELVNMLQLIETKTVIININDTLHDNAFSGYYAISDWFVNKEEDDNQVVINTHSLNGVNIMQLYSPEALNNPELYTPVDSDAH